jgi:hypothetical protein
VPGPVEESPDVDPDCEFDPARADEVEPAGICPQAEVIEISIPKIRTTDSPLNLRINDLLPRRSNRFDEIQLSEDSID